jgi:hypothetical protein
VQVSQAPAAQVPPQAWSQPPQCRASVLGLTQPSVPQQINGGVHAMAPLQEHTRPTHPSPVGAQSVPHPPQLFGSLRTSTQAPSQHSSEPSQAPVPLPEQLLTHWPSRQTCPEGHPDAHPPSPPPSVSASGSDTSMLPLQLTRDSATTRSTRQQECGIVMSDSSVARSREPRQRGDPSPRDDLRASLPFSFAKCVMNG